MKKLGILLTAALIVLAGSTMSFAYTGSGIGGGGTILPPTMAVWNIVVNPSNPNEVVGTEVGRLTRSTTLYNVYGVVIGSSSVSISSTIVNIGADTDHDGQLDAGATWEQQSTTVTISDVTAEWTGGSLRTSKVETTSITHTGNDTTTSVYTDTYNYNAAGDLLGIDSVGEYRALTIEEGGNIIGATIGRIERQYEIRDGQALLLSSVTEGDSYVNVEGMEVDVTGSVTDPVTGEIKSITLRTGAEASSSFKQGTVIKAGDYSYLGGSWVSMLDTQFSESTQGNDYGHEAKQTSYERNANGLISNINQYVFYSENFQADGISGTTVAGYTSHLNPNTAVYGADDNNDGRPDLDSGYKATTAFSLTEGWVILSEDKIETPGVWTGETNTTNPTWTDTWDSLKAAYGF